MMQQAFACEPPQGISYTGDMERIEDGYLTLWRSNSGKEYLRIERRGEYHWFRLEIMSEVTTM
jgi:hypothetical protein